VKILRSLQAPQRRAVEWPTLLLAAIIYAAWAALTYWHGVLPAAVVALAGAWLVAWHSSLQHELIHGHPTASPLINRALGFLPLSLWLPFERYRELHLRHHRDECLTDPLDDPESRYVEPARWHALPPLARLLLRAQSTLLGRLVIGPAWSISHFLAAEARDLRAHRRLAGILAHAAGTVLVVLWLELVCNMSLWFYAFAIVYPATSLLLVRSFAEHRAAGRVTERTAVVEKSWLFGPLFLFNNLHAAHHERPALAWYELPGWYRANRERLIAANGGLVYDGYGDVAQRFFLTPHDAPPHPLGRATLGAMPATSPLGSSRPDAPGPSALKQGAAKPWCVLRDATYGGSSG
jgi:fatty acid desaturase